MSRCSSTSSFSGDGVEESPRVWTPTGMTLPKTPLRQSISFPVVGFSSWSASRRSSTSSSFSGEETPSRRRAATAPVISDVPLQLSADSYVMNEADNSPSLVPSDSNAEEVGKKSKSLHVSIFRMAAGITSLLNVLVAATSSATLLGISASTAGKLAFVIAAFQAVPFAGQIALAVGCGVLAILAGVYFVRALSKSAQGAGIFPRKSPVLTKQTTKDFVEGSSRSSTPVLC